MFFVHYVFILFGSVWDHSGVILESFSNKNARRRAENNFREPVLATRATKKEYSGELGPKK